VARCDCGDVNAPNRFTRQVSFLKENPELLLVGSWVRFVSPSGELLFTFTPPTEHEQIRKFMFVNNAFAHPSVVFRAELVRKIGFYPTDAPGAEDYAYFFKAVKAGKTANLPEFLVTCVVNPEGISVKRRRRQLLTRLSVIASHFNDDPPRVLYGLMRNLPLLLLPYAWVERLKRWRA